MSDAERATMIENRQLYDDSYFSKLSKEDDVFRERWQRAGKFLFDEGGVALQVSRQAKGDKIEAAILIAHKKGNSKPRNSRSQMIPVDLSKDDFAQQVEELGGIAKSIVALRIAGWHLKRDEKYMEIRPDRERLNVVHPVTKEPAAAFMRPQKAYKEGQMRKTSLRKLREFRREIDALPSPDSLAPKSSAEIEEKLAEAEALFKTRRTEDVLPLVQARAPEADAEEMVMIGERAIELVEQGSSTAQAIEQAIAATGLRGRL